MDRFMRAYIRYIDGFNRGLGRIVMYGIFVMMAILLWSSISKTFFQPSLWTLEMAQFAMVAYYILGGPYSIQLGSNVRMDLFYGEWTIRRKAWFDAITVLFLMFYLGVLFYGAIGSMSYGLGYWGDDYFAFLGSIIWAFVTGGPDAAGEILGRLERSPTAWRPYLWPIKIIMIFGFLMMFLQALSEFLKDVLTLREGEA